MGYLDNSSVTVDAILTLKGRELLAKGGDSFNITQFALGDDEIDYSLWNPDHPLGTAYYGTSSYSSSSYAALSLKKFTGSLAEIQDYLPQGINNQRYSGAKLSSPAFNINSIQTVDGGPSVEWRESNPNQLIYQNNGQQGSFVLV